MRALIVGLGSIGSRHLANLRTIDPNASIAVWHQRATRRSIAASGSLEYEPLFSTAEAIAWKPDIALVANPASHHLETASQLAQRDVHILIEKPLAASPRGVEDFLTLCDRRSVTVMVGYNLRFHSALRELHRVLTEGGTGRILHIHATVGQFLPSWRTSDYRTGTSARRSLGGGALLELSHEIDYVRWLAGNVCGVTAWIARVSDLEIDVEDTAELSLRFDSGVRAQVHLDMVDRAAHRGCRIIGSEGTLQWCSTDREVRIYRAESNRWETLHRYSEEAHNEMYVEELQHFLSCVRTGEQPLVSGLDGLRVLQVVEAARASSRSGQEVKLCSRSS